MKSENKSVTGVHIQEGQKESKPTWRAMEINFVGEDMIKMFGLWQLFWGTDIFINKVPFLKLLILANIIVWVMLGTIR